MSEILLGVGGGIAAYKSCEILRRLQDDGHNVTVVPTPASLNFVGRATWEALSGKPVHTEVWEKIEKVNHVALGEKAEYILIAPATADLLARLAHGRADDLLTNSVLASSAIKMLVPAMHPKMWLNPATQKNVEALKRLGFIIMDPAVGRLTGKDSGIGRMPEPEEIISKFTNEVIVSKHLLGKKILITTGGTREALDDVRFIGNRSSGKQGLAIARVAAAMGASVTVIAANVDTKNIIGCEVIPVSNTQDLQQALNVHFPECDVLIMAAAVSDARPESASGKIKKSDLTSIKLIENPDLLANLSNLRKNQLMVGFAAEERQNLLSEGTRKLEAKKLDLMYSNDISNGEIFGSDLTSGYLITRDEAIEISETSKENLASLLMKKVVERLESANV
ncbi:MAG: bifunctional phosphopantothenoylcysteine decarboxylase/phosphopantothenate--cysteine ligase CoaBC [Candidatus Nanopelagicaceae bacterium]